MEKSGGLSSTISSSSDRSIGLAAVPSCSLMPCMASAAGIGIFAHRVVARRARLCRGGATHDAVDETVVTDEMDDARDERVTSLIIESGLERSELLIDGRRLRYLSKPAIG